jgi:Fe-S cluster assembly protein SufB
MKQQIQDINLEKYDFKTSEKNILKLKKGLSEEIIREISKIKNEPEWMLDLRLKSYEIFKRKPMPGWGPDLRELNFDEITYFIKPGSEKTGNWEDVPSEIKETFEKLGVPEAERKFLAGSVAVYEAEGVYHNIKEKWEKQGVIFTDMDTAVQKYPELVKEYFMKCVPSDDNKFSALHGAVWSGGSFVYIPDGVKVELPLQTYFRMNAEKEGQFEHTLIIAQPGAEVHYVEGCTAPRYSSHSLHSAVVEIYAKENSKVRYTTVQNWAKNIFNLNTKRAIVDRNARMEWVSGSLGSYITMLYPSSILKGENASASHLSIAFASENTWKDSGAKVIHLAPHTTSKVIAKSLSFGSGVAVYRGLARINKGALNARSHVQCDALILDEKSRSDTYPHNEIYESTATFEHEASVGKISDEHLFYLMSRGLSESDAKSMIVLGFLDDVLKEIPMEFSLELNRLIKLEMSKLGATG